MSLKMQFSWRVFFLAFVVYFSPFNNLMAPAVGWAADNHSEFSSSSSDAKSPVSKTMLNKCRQYLEQNKFTYEAMVFGNREGGRFISRINVVVDPRLYKFVQKLRGPKVIDNLVLQDKMSVKINQEKGFLLITAPYATDSANIMQRIKEVGASFNESSFILHLFTPLSTIYAGGALALIGLSYPDIERAFGAVGVLALFSFMCDMCAWMQADDHEEEFANFENMSRSLVKDERFAGWDDVHLMLVLQDLEQLAVVDEFFQRIGLEVMEQDDLGPNVEDDPPK